MATTKQKRIAKLVVENATLDKPLTGGQMLAKVSYSKGLQKQPSRILESEGVKEALDELGFSEENAKKVVGNILLKETAKDTDRLKAAEQIFKVQGSYAPEKNVNVNIEIEADDIVKDIAHQLNEIHRGTSIAGDGGTTSSLDTEAQDKD